MKNRKSVSQGLTGEHTVAKEAKDSLIRLSKSCLSDAEKNAVIGVLNREYLGMGDEVRRFEAALEEFLGRPAVCVANGTAALHLAIQAAGIGQGDEVLVQSMTYVASFQAISATGARPVACDVNPDSLTLDWRDAEKRISPRTKAVMPVHYSGGAGALDEIYEFAKKYDLRVIEDAAHAFGSEYNGKKIGGFGDTACFSFDGIKNITSGEGGCVVTSDQRILEKVKDARLLGVRRDTDARFSGKRSWHPDVTAQGWRYHMSNLMAAIGLVQLANFDRPAERRRLLAQLYHRRLTGHSSITPILVDFSTIVPHIFVVRINGLIDRGRLRKEMLEQGIETGIHYFPSHELSYYHDENLDPLPVTEILSQEVLTLPLHPDLSDKDIERVVETLLSCLSTNRLISVGKTQLA